MDISEGTTLLHGIDLDEEDLDPLYIVPHSFLNPPKPFFDDPDLELESFEQWVLKIQKTVSREATLDDTTLPPPPWNSSMSLTSLILWETYDFITFVGSESGSKESESTSSEGTSGTKHNSNDQEVDIQ